MVKPLSLSSDFSLATVRFVSELHQQMENPTSEAIHLSFRWRERRRAAVAQVVALLIYWFWRRRRSSNMVPRAMMVCERERVREEIMDRIIGSGTSRNMVILYGKDRETGEQSETAKESRKRLHSSIDLEYGDSIDGIDEMVSQNEVLLDVASICPDEIQAMLTGTAVKSNNIEKKTNKRSKKSKTVVDDESHFFKDAIFSIADALREGNVAYMKAKLPVPMREDEVWQFVEMEIEPSLMEKAYAFLLDRPDKLKALLGIPFERRKSLLQLYMFGSSRGSGK